MNTENKITLDDLFSSMRERGRETSSKLPNNKETWERIGNGDDFPELGLNKIELEEFLTSWISDNPYSNI